MSSSSIIRNGDMIILEKLNYMRTHKFISGKSVQLGRDIVDISAVEGAAFGTAWKMVPLAAAAQDESGGRKKPVKPTFEKNWRTKPGAAGFRLERSEKTLDFEEHFLKEEGESGADNRNISDHTGPVSSDKPVSNSQRLTREEIEQLREDGAPGHEIVGRIIEASASFKQKTRFSQAKFLKKKAAKYHDFVSLRKPTIRLLMQIYYKSEPMKILNLRVDSLAQLINQANVRSGGKYFVYESGCQAVVVAAALERVGAQVGGAVIHVYQTGNPQTQSLNAMNFQPNVRTNLLTLNMYHLRSLARGRDIAVMHPNAGGGADIRSGWCFGCGSTAHGLTREDRWSRCPLRDHTCQKCKRIGHSDKTCRSAVPVNEGSVAPADEGSVAPADEGSVAAANDNSVPPAVEDSVAPVDKDTVAVADEDSVAPTDEDSVAAAGDAKTAAVGDNFDSMTESSLGEKSTDDRCSPAPAAAAAVAAAAAAAAASGAKVPHRQGLREGSISAYEMMKARNMDGLLIAAKQDPTNILRALMPYLSPSRPFVLFCPYKEPLMEAYMAAKEMGAVMVGLSETWLRNYQVLPSRTHPEVLMSGGGGYILSGIAVDATEEQHSGRTDTVERNGEEGGGRRAKRFRRR